MCSSDLFSNTKYKKHAVRKAKKYSLDENSSSKNKTAIFHIHPTHDIMHFYLRRLIEERALKARGVFTGSVRPIKRM